MAEKRDNNEDLSIDEIVKRLKANIAEERRGEPAAEPSSAAGETVPDSDDALRAFIRKYSSEETEVPAEASAPESPEPANTPEEGLTKESDEAELPAEKASAPAEPERGTPHRRFRLTRQVKLHAPETEKPVIEQTDKTGAALPTAEPAEPKDVPEEPADAFAAVASSADSKFRADAGSAAVETVEEPAAEAVEEPAESAGFAEAEESAGFAGSAETEEPAEVAETAEAEEASADGDDRDLELMLALGMDVDRDAMEKIVSEKSLNGDEDTPPLDFEYTEPSQNREILANLTREFKKSRLRLILTGVLGFLLLLLEGLPALGVDLPGALNLFSYPSVYVWVDLQLFVLCAALVYVPLFHGAKNLFSGYATPESLSFVIAALTVISSVSVSIAGVTSSVLLYSFPASLCMILTAAFEFMNLKRDLMSFHVVSSTRPKHGVATATAGEASREAAAVSGAIRSADPRILRVRKTAFISDFFSRSHTGSSGNRINIILIPLAVAAMIAFFIVSTVRDGFTAGVSVANATLLFALPVSTFFANVLPMLAASRRAMNEDCAILGAAAVDEYANASVVVFDDKDVFPAQGIRVRSVKVFNDNRIDRILYLATSVFTRAQGPLTDVFQNATAELGHSEDVSLTEVTDDGISATVDGESVLVGNEQYLEEAGIYPTYDPEDEITQKNGDAGVLYIVHGGMIGAKLYVTYAVDAEFESVLKRLYGAGICAVIKTFDPNINDGLLGRAIKLSRYPVKILRCTPEDSLGDEHEKMSTGIVTKASVKSLLNTIVMCQDLHGIFRINQIVKIAACAVSLAILLLTVIFHTNLSPMLVALYQVVWAVPTVLLTRLRLK